MASIPLDVRLHLDGVPTLKPLVDAAITFLTAATVTLTKIGVLVPTEQELQAALDEAKGLADSLTSALAAATARDQAVTDFIAHLEANADDIPQDIMDSAQSLKATLQASKDSVDTLGHQADQPTPPEPTP
jgi:hypothetical protein